MGRKKEERKKENPTTHNKKTQNPKKWRKAALGEKKKTDKEINSGIG